MFRLTSYLERIGLRDRPKGAEGLRELQESHMRAIPFENVDPLLGLVPRLDHGGLVAKLVEGGRGGYCFEHNTLLGTALDALGYSPRTLLARVRNGASVGGARTHLAFEVETDGARWLVDTGFGGHGPLHPVALGSSEPQVMPNGTYRVVADAAAGETVLERRAGENWISLYGFDTMPVRSIDLEAANFLCARWDGAPFTTNLMLAFQGPEGRRAMFNRAFTVGRPHTSETHVIETQDHFAAVLLSDFGLALGGAEITAIWNKIKDAPTGR